VKKCNKALLLQELIEKFDLQQWEYEPLLFAETIIPVYDIHTHLERWTGKSESITITGNGIKNIHTCPKDERWHIRRWGLFQVGGDFTWDDLQVDRNGVSVPIRHFDTGQTFTIYEPYQDLILEANHILQVEIAYTAEGDLYSFLDVKVEKIR